MVGCSTYHFLFVQYVNATCGLPCPCLCYSMCCRRVTCWKSALYWLRPVLNCDVVIFNTFPYNTNKINKNINNPEIIVMDNISTWNDAIDALIKFGMGLMKGWEMLFKWANMLFICDVREDTWIRTFPRHTKGVLSSARKRRPWKKSPLPCLQNWGRQRRVRLTLREETAVYRHYTGRICPRRYNTYSRRFSV